MPSRLLHLRLWLDKNNLFPRGKLAFMTVYLAGLDLLLFVIRKLAGLIRGGYAQSLAGWTTFLSLVVLALAVVLLWRWLSARLLWRVRNRLLVTYLFIGLIPLVLLVSLAGLAFYLFAGQFATYIVTSKLDADLEKLGSSNLVIARELAAALDTGRQPETVASEQSLAWSDRDLCFWLDGKLLYHRAAPGVVSASLLLPGYLPVQFARVVRDDHRLLLRAANSLPTRDGKLTVVSSRALDPRLLLDLSANLGEVTLFASGMTLRKMGKNPAAASPSVEPPSRSLGDKGAKYELGGAGTLRPTFAVGNVPEPTWALDRRVSFPTAVEVANWGNGDTSEPAAISVETRLSKLFDHLFSSLGYFAPSIEVLLAVAAVLFIITEAIAWWIGTRLTRSVTGAVAQLYRATTHINRGDFSHRVPISSNDQLAALAGSFNLMTESIEKLILEQKEKHRLESEITIAQEVQAQLFPRHISQLPSLEVHGFCRPARSVSGDYYDFVNLGRERLALAVGDVSGKGISAALLMATIHSAVRAYSIEGIPALRQVQPVAAGGLATGESYGSLAAGAEISPATLLSLLNHQLYHSTPPENYATLFLAMYDAPERRLHYSNAGHLPPLVLGQGDGTLRRLREGDTVVGLFEDVSYQQSSVQLRPGDVFLAYSDGITEPENDFGEFGEQRLIELVQENRDLPLARISELVTAAVDDWIAGAEQPDDVTLVLARAR